MNHLAPSLTLLYSELVQQLHLSRERAGSIYRRTKGNAEYVYLKSQTGRMRQDIFLGRADDESIQKRIAEIEAENGRAKNRRALITALRVAGIPTPGTDLGNTLEAIEHSGLWRNMVVVGTAAYQCYSALIGALLPGDTLMTQDADFATRSLAIAADVQDENLETILRRADPSFTAVPAIPTSALPSHFRTAGGFVVDLLTPQRSRTDTNAMPIPALRAGATPLQHLGWLIETPAKAAVLHGSGVAALVPAPARYAIHKLIVAQKRGGDRQKRSKDLAQAKALIDALRETDRYALADAYEDAANRGEKGWRQPLAKSLNELDLTPADIGG